MRNYHSVFGGNYDSGFTTSDYFDSEYYKTNREISYTDIDSKFNLSNGGYICHHYFIDECLDELVIGFLYEDNSVHDENINLIDYLL